MTDSSSQSAFCTADDPDSVVPLVHLLSNGSYHVMVSGAGGGYSRWKDLAVTRWIEDTTRDNWGSFCYIADVDSGHTWSSGHQPVLRRADRYAVTFSPGQARFSRRDEDCETVTDIVVAPDDDVELRRVRITNVSKAPKTLEVTSYAEIVLAPAAADAAHPAFSNLFVETEWLTESGAIVCTRRPASTDESAPWMFHLLAVRNPDPGELSCETDRMRFIGRGRTAATPQALDDRSPLSGSVGPVLDPVAAIRCAVTLAPGATAHIDLVTGAGGSRDACVALIDKYRDVEKADHVSAGTAAQAQAMLDKLRLNPRAAQLYSSLASFVIYASPSLRAAPDVLARNSLGQSSLWAYAISGDLPIVLLQIANPENIDLARQLIDAHAFWRLYGLAVDLLVLCTGNDGASLALHEQITQLIVARGETGHVDQPPGGIYVHLAEGIAEADRVLMQTVARVVLDDKDGSLDQQIERGRAAPPAVAARPPPVPAGLPVEGPAADLAPPSAAVKLPDGRALSFWNGLGGFSPDGREYVITLQAGQPTPVPWINVLANPDFGTLVSESGSATTWSENAQEFRLTPWSNDPVSDANTEACYVRDEDSGHFWSPTRLPAGGTGPHTIRHGFGYSLFQHSEHGIETELTVYVAIDAPVKYAVLKLINRSGRHRRLSVTGYLEWVLGDERAKTGMHISTAFDAGNGAVLARNPYSTDFSSRTAFFAVDAATGASFSGDRAGFLGRNGTLNAPAALWRASLDGSAGTGLDPCAAIRVPCDLAEGRSREIIFRLGAAVDKPAVQQLLRDTSGRDAAHEALTRVKQYWQHAVDAVQVETPDQPLNLLTNGWLVYQVLACRLWARNAFYQSSGAFGFRDQLQDVMALVHCEPALVREHLLRCAARQFPEGDVQHWWHPPSGRGLRSRCSDDYLWLPLATCRYVHATGDVSVLSETAHFLDGRPLAANEDSCYDLPTRSGQVATLYEHCVLAIEHGLRLGVHELPLMGSGDWNDGMNRVGIGGKGESVWLGFFLYGVLAQFGELAVQRGDAAFATRCAGEALRLRDAIEEYAWDGAWYRRAWFDDGSPLGTSENTECRIDSIAQSWAVLSGAARPERARMAMNAVDRMLVHRDSALIQLLDPPFDHSDPNPGYIQGYVRGVRENGGQYTHAAVWVAMAFAALGDGDRAWELCSLINPVNHAQSSDAIARYKTEPYVMAGDVYALTPHVGRGGWTWYTGSAGWMLQLTLESILGVTRHGEQLRLAPCVPGHWTSFRVRYRYGRAHYNIAVSLTAPDEGSPKLTVDGIDLAGIVIAMVDDAREHSVEFRTPRGTRAAPGESGGVPTRQAPITSHR